MQCYDPGTLNFHFPPAPIQTAVTPPAPVKPPSAPAPVRPSTPPRVPTPSHETTHQRQLQDAWEEGYDSVMKSPSHTSARAPSPSRTVHMKSPSPTPTRMIISLPRRRISPPRDKSEDPISPTRQWLIDQAPKTPSPPAPADFADYKHFMPNLAEKRPKTVSFYDVKDPTHPYYKHS